MAKKTKSPHKLTFRLADGSFAVTGRAENEITPRLARSLYRSGVREFKVREGSWRSLQELMEARHAAV